MSDSSGIDDTSPYAYLRQDRFARTPQSGQTQLIDSSDILSGDGLAKSRPEFTFPDTFFGVDIATAARKFLAQTVMVTNFPSPLVAVVYRPEDTWDRFWFSLDCGFDLDSDGISLSRDLTLLACREARFYLRTGQLPHVGNFHLFRVGDRVCDVNNGISTHEGIVVSVMSQYPAHDSKLARDIAGFVAHLMSEAVMSWRSAHPDEYFLGQSLAP